MKVSRINVVFGVVFFVATAAFNTAIFAGECLPCENVSPCDTVDCGDKKSSFDFGGWAQAGVYTNSHGYRNGLGANGPGHSFTQRNDVNLNQLYLYAEKTLNTKRGFDFGWRAEALYGSDAWIVSDFNDGNFDAKSQTSRDSGFGYGYGFSVPQLYASVGYKDLTVKLGKFYTLVGWEAVAADQEFFYSHTFGYWAEPSTHTGAVADYKVNDRLSVSAGWTTGLSNSIENKYNDTGFLTGFTFALTDKSNIYYYTTFGKTKNPGNERDFGLDVDRQDYFIQSLVFEWLPTDRWQFVTQWDLNNYTNVGVARQHSSTYSINQRVIYKLTDVWSVGTRVEWYKDSEYSWGTEDAEYVGITFGVNFDPNKHLSIRPELRYDAVTAGKGNFDGGVLPYGNGHSDQLSGGAALLYRF
ncbi:hypothetical protein FACS189454_09850 [Planctomycetales bacterium]|nr:hypothetical protein FACS189454_09850 [Planctomycetales bacterium]